jgi:predicted ATPase
MLKRIHLKDFKSFVDEEVEIAPLTLLVGANASGKSNFLEALRFLQGTEFHMSLSEILNGEDRPGPDLWPGLRGRAEEAARIGTSKFTIESEWIAPKCRGTGPLKTVNVSHSISCRTKPYPDLDAESLSRGDGQRLFSGAARESGFFEVCWEPETHPDSRVQVPWSNHSLLWLILGGTSSPRTYNVPVEVVDHVLSLSEVLKRIRVLEILPAVMRGYGRRGAPLGDDGANFSGVLADLSSDPLQRTSLVGWIAEFSAPEVKGLDFLDIKELGDVMAMFVETGGKRISARSISDGTLHFLGTLLALRTAEPGSVFLVEDIEAGLHPTRIRLLVEYLEAVTRERQIQVIATTHSPVVLQWLSDESLRNAIVFGRVPDHEGTIMRRLGDLPDFNEVIQRTGIDELFTTGWLEMAL